MYVVCFGERSAYVAAACMSSCVLCVIACVLCISVASFGFLCVRLNSSLSY